MDAKTAREIKKAAKGATTEETLIRLHRAIESAAGLQRDSVRAHCDKMTEKVAAATLAALKKEEYEVTADPDAKVPGRVWFEIAW